MYIRAMRSRASALPSTISASWRLQALDDRGEAVLESARAVAVRPPGPPRHPASRAAASLTRRLCGADVALVTLGEGGHRQGAEDDQERTSTARRCRRARTPPSRGARASGLFMYASNDMRHPDCVLGADVRRSTRDTANIPIRATRPTSHEQTKISIIAASVPVGILLIIGIRLRHRPLDQLRRDPR